MAALDPGRVSCPAHSPYRNKIAHVAVAHRLLTLRFYALRDEGGKVGARAASAVARALLIARAGHREAG